MVNEATALFLTNDCCRKSAIVYRKCACYGPTLWLKNDIERKFTMLEIYTDGASSGDPGPSGAGIYIKNGDEKHEYMYFLGNLSNHEAEFHAVIKALEICKGSFPNEILSFRSDSQLVVDVIDKNFTKNPKFKPLLDKISNELQGFPLFFIKWIPEKQNKNADRLARNAIRLKQ